MSCQVPDPCAQSSSTEGPSPEDTVPIVNQTLVPKRHLHLESVCFPKVSHHWVFTDIHLSHRDMHTHKHNCYTPTHLSQTHTCYIHTHLSHRDTHTHINYHKHICNTNTHLLNENPHLSHTHIHLSDTHVTHTRVSHTH